MSSQLPLFAKYYTDSHYFDIEKEQIFYQTWQCVGHISEIVNVGDYLTHRIVDEDIFVIRDKSGSLQAFYNICLHRGHPLVEGCGSKPNSLTCPYHAWTYDLNGELMRIPGASNEDKLNCKQMRLRKICVEEFSGFIFVNLDDNASSLRDQLGELESVIHSYHPSSNQLQFICETSIEHQCNWKISVENYNECYHCPTIHATSLTKGVLSMDGYTTVPHGMMIWHEGKAQSENQKQYEYDTEKSPRAGDYGAYWIWPNVAFCCYPGGYFTIRQWLPINRKKTIYRYRWFSDGSLSDEEVIALMNKHKKTTGAEDEIVVSKVQKSMSSRAFEPAPYIIGDGIGAQSEVGVRHFHRLYQRAIHQ